MVREHKLSLAEYLAWENTQSGRHEYWRGEVFAMVGAKRGHGRVVANLMRHLGNQLADTPCQPFSENMKVQAGTDVFYPDVFVTCEREFGSDQAVFEAPVLLIEVLSPSTEAYDRGKKWASYRQLRSLRQYVLIDPDARTVETYRRDSGGAWDFIDLSHSTTLDLECVSCRIAVDDLFNGMASE